MKFFCVQSVAAVSNTSLTHAVHWASVERDQTPEDRGEVTLDTGVQREIILAKDSPLCGMRNLLLRSRAEPV
jgi:hypothetical protein